MTAEQALAKRARVQHGLFTTRQALDCGLSRGQLKRMTAQGLFLTVRRGVYMVAGAPPSPHQPVMAAVLAAGAGVAASHHCAAVLWGLRGYGPSPRIDLTVVDRHVRLAGVGVHRVAELPRNQRKLIYGVPVTSPARTLVDMAAQSTRYKLEKAWDDAERRNLLTDREVQRVADHVGRRNLTEEFIDLLNHRIAPCDGPLAKEVLAAILKAGIEHPELEYEVVVEKRVFHLDMAWPAHKTAVEVEGWEAHRQRGPFDHDADREAALVAAGWCILRVTSRTKPALPARLSRALAARTMAA